MAATVSSRTPEGAPNHCPVCGALICIEPSTPSGDAPCPNCGVLLWFLRTSAGVRVYEADAVASVRERVANMLAQALNVNEEGLLRTTSFKDDLGVDSLDAVELVMALEEEFEFTIPPGEAERIRTLGDLIDWLIRHLR